MGRAEAKDSALLGFSFVLGTTFRLPQDDSSFLWRSVAKVWTPNEMSHLKLPRPEKLADCQRSA